MTSRQFIRHTLDPFGIAESLTTVQLAWVQHPEILLKHMQHLASDVGQLQIAAWQRFLGLPANPPANAVKNDIRFQDPARCLLRIGVL